MKLLAIVVALTLVLSGCATGPTSSAPAQAPSTPEATATVPATTRAPAPASTPQTTATQTGATSRCPGGSLEGCFSYGEMQDYLDAITPMVAQFFETRYPGVSRPRAIVFIPSDRVARTACGASTGTAFEYCGGDQTIYIGQDLLWEFYSGAGDAAPAVALAHEWGHHLQFMLGVSADTRAREIAFENQADCIAGAWAKYAGEQGWLEDNDVKDAQTLLEAIGSRESSNRDHGTSAEREAAFAKSYAGGIAACDTYFPRTPLA